VAYMTQTIDPQPTDRVLEIGTGSGYQAAVLSGLVREVYTIEIIEPLGRRAAKLLEQLGYDNVHVKIGDGYLGWPEHAPFDKIIVTCSPENVPRPLVEQLRDGGRMLIPLGQRYQQTFYLLEKHDGRLQTKRLLPALFVPMTGLAEAERRDRPDPLHPKLLNGSFERDENGDGRADGWYYQRQVRRIAAPDAPDGNYCVVFENQTPGRLSQLLQGFAVDGRAVGFLQVSVAARLDQARPGNAPNELPGLSVYYFDSERKIIGAEVIGPWTRPRGWRHYQRRLPVPSAAREAILRVGLNGATGRLSVDDVRLQAVPR